MVELNWVDLLSANGDPIERKGIAECDLGNTFPKYAEFWGKYIFPNRDQKDFSKLRPGFPPEIEDVFNNHYSVFYHLATALYQLKNLDQPVLDIATPFYHLGAVVDLTERTFIAAIRASGELRIEALEKNAFYERVDKFWGKEYQAQFGDFSNRYRPVSINLHNVSTLFEQQGFGNTKFRRAAGSIRHYRNTLIHSLYPLKLIIGGKTHIPKEKYLTLGGECNWRHCQDFD